MISAAKPRSHDSRVISHHVRVSLVLGFLVGVMAEGGVPKRESREPEAPKD